ncbi:MAG TPA: DUF366 family protein [Methanocella sp.]|nr:DUF366 family protein [Methanocella sp.]
MKCIISDQRIDYDGSQISSLWAYTVYKVQDDSIVCFRGGCDVTIGHMIDLEDRLNEERIYSPDMIHFIAEHFDSTSISLAYTRQRLMSCIAGEALRDRRISSTRSGDDLFLNGEKASISIASSSAVSHKIHFGINVRSDEWGSLEKVSVPDPDELMAEIGSRYAAECDDIQKDMRKSRPLEVFSP